MRSELTLRNQSVARTLPLSDFSLSIWDTLLGLNLFSIRLSDLGCLILISLCTHSSRTLPPHPLRPTGSQNLGASCSAPSFHLCKLHCRAKDDTGFSASFLPSLGTSSFATSFVPLISLPVFRSLSFLLRYFSLFCSRLLCLLSSQRGNIEICLPELYYVM